MRLNYPSKKYSDIIQMAKYQGNHPFILILMLAHFPLLLTHWPRPCLTLLTCNLHDAAGSRCESVSYCRGDSEVNNVESQTDRTQRSSVWCFGKTVVFVAPLKTRRRGSWCPSTLGTGNLVRRKKQKGGGKKNTFFCLGYRKEAVLAAVCFLKRTES